MPAEAIQFPLEMRRAEGGGGKHILTGLCVPYNRVTMNVAATRGEKFAPGAFATAPAAASKIRLTDSHQPGEARRPVGVATALQDAPDGLYGTFRFYDTPEGRGAWENVQEGTYGGLSVGFHVVKARTSVLDGCREVLEARLYHVSLVDEPAYEDAKVLAVRAADSLLEERVTALLGRDWSHLVK